MPMPGTATALTAVQTHPERYTITPTCKDLYLMGQLLLLIVVGNASGLQYC